MSMKWWTAYSSSKGEGKGSASALRRRTAGALAVAALSVALAGCSLLPDEPEEEDLSMIQLPQISKKPEYEVTTKTLETKVQASGKIMSTQEKTLYFTSKNLDGKYLKTLYIQIGQQVQAGDPIAELDVEDLKKSLRGQELSFRQAEMEMKQTLREKDEMDPIEFEQKQIAFEEQRQAIADLRQDIADAVLTAPYAGTVVSLSVQEGMSVKAYDPICIIADPSKLVVAGDFSRDDLSRIAVGMEAVVDINTVGSVTGEVKSLPSETNDNGQDGGGGGQQIERPEQYLLVDVPDLPETVTRGTPLTVSVVVNRKENAVVIPLSALRTIGARTYVQVAEADGTKREVDIEVGQKTSTDAEVLAGLTPGQKVVGQ
ncbi:efflux RND transporter periplasmic adaptor subunit [Cohnella lubricantis]|uniref:Efflux RND transporter periplasmic adaptor subunit n=1 Tax=Cohnella lubricantis TaxID=2163172 RepID=A0A841T7I2_9BACL|nr:efflux RND transporter periplasmic adaptor subunit [Cohnella lubricantis]MBB6677284.1 efflux RND transporter periplasmic adaptor subunit [Cohnella lubricantis]MBP2116904.1 macrolide-specific efflux system membrane fusion protein [Cohnella lubricantis]